MGKGLVRFAVGAALVALTGCPSKSDDAVPSGNDGATNPSSTSLGATPKAVDRPAASKDEESIRFTDVRPQPEKVMFDIMPMGKGEPSYEVELDVKAWSFTGHRQAGNDRRDVRKATPVPSTHRAALEKSVHAMKLVTASAEECRARKEGRVVGCGDSWSLTVGSTLYNNDNKSCHWVAFDDGNNPYMAIARAFDAVVMKP
jgi:hypothetical protein